MSAAVALASAPFILFLAGLTVGFVGYVAWVERAQRRRAIARVRADLEQHITDALNAANPRDELAPRRHAARAQQRGQARGDVR